MTDREALMGAILDNPDCDTARLVYADYLDENGNGEEDRVHAEFIRTQIDFYRQPGGDQCNQCRSISLGQATSNGPCRCTQKVKELRRRQHELWQGWLSTVFWQLPKTLSPRAWHATCRRGTHAGEPIAILERGFVSDIQITCAEYFRPGFAEALFATQPVTAVKLTDCASYERTRDKWSMVWPLRTRGWEGQKWMDRVLAGGFATKEKVALHLSNVAVAWGRMKAGLSEWNPTPTKQLQVEGTVS